MIWTCTSCGQNLSREERQFFDLKIHGWSDEETDMRFRCFCKTCMQRVLQDLDGLESFGPK